MASPGWVLAQDAPFKVDLTTVTGPTYVPAQISHELSDPTFLPSPGQLSGTTEFRYDTLHSDIYADAGALSSRERADTTEGLQSLSYGVIRNLAVTLEASVASESVRETSASGSEQISRREGFADPTFAATYRALRQGLAPLTLDVSVVYAPNLINARDASALGNGSLARGGDLVRLTAAAARVNAFETVQINVRADHYGSATREGASGYDTDSQAYWSPSVGISTQTRFTPRIALNLDGRYVFDETTNVYYAEEKLNAVNGVGSEGLATAELVYRVIPFRLDASVEYGHTVYGRAYTNFVGDPTDDSHLSRSEDQVLLRLRYLLR